MVLQNASKGCPSDEGSKNGSWSLKLGAEKFKSSKMQNERKEFFLCLEAVSRVEWTENEVIYVVISVCVS